ncbi:protein-export membrane protein SecF [Gemmatimonadetes bacterium T265]|nr:protein-export membrane protein SecF [Gemmatimonadetes bacterium T265]
MLRIFHDTHYDFIKWWRAMAIATATFIIVGMGATLLRGGLRYSIDFTGGTLMQLAFQQKPDVAQLRAALDAGGVRDAEITQFGSDREFTVRAQDENASAGASTHGAESVARRVRDVLAQRFGASAFTVVRTEAVGPRVGSELRRGAIIAILVSFALTLIYLWFRFEWRFGLAAVIATAHDIFTTIAFIGLMHLEVSLTVIAAILTVIGYSLNDTIIIFDRVRENLRKHRGMPLYDLVNLSVNETLPRSVLTHATTLGATLALLLFAGEVIRPFAWVMAFGIFTGTFSSIYVASAILIWIERRYPRPAVDARRAPAARPAVRPDRTLAAS